ncbi:MAG: ABC transporter ATP-binding protein [Planctomycetes bacterium]|nr:ABC transporter ATP-binding protein [Planctomycetota bacterium]
MSDPAVVETVALTKRYGDFTALDALSIRLEKGQILGFIGPNGAGKTTTIKILVGLSRPTSGRAAINGVDCTAEARKIKHFVGYMPDTFGSYDNMRVREYLDFFGAAFKIPRHQRQDRINASLAITGATHMADLYVESLSHGMKQRVAIARTLLHDPPVLILDEPANGLDPAARVEMREILLNLAQSGKTLIVTSHILPELARICNMVAIMTHGKLRAFGTLDQIMQDVRHQRMIEIQLLSEEDVVQAAEILRQHLGPTVAVTESLSELMVRFNTTGNEQSLALALQRLVSAQVRVSQFREMQQDLEDAFLSVTQEPQSEMAAQEVQA